MAPTFERGMVPGEIPGQGFAIPRMKHRARTPSPWEELNPDAWPVDPNAPPTCCDGINGSHTVLCPVNVGATIHCWCCGDDHSSSRAGMWSAKGYRCMVCEGCDYHADGLGCLKFAAQARQLAGCL